MQRAEIARHHVAHQRLIEIFHDAQAVGHLAIEIEVLAIADDEHADVRFDHVGQFAQCRQRLVLAADIDDQYARRGHALQCHHRRRAPCRGGFRSPAAPPPSGLRASAVSVSWSLTKAMTVRPVRPLPLRCRRFGQGGIVGRHYWAPSRLYGSIRSQSARMISRSGTVECNSHATGQTQRRYVGGRRDRIRSGTPCLQSSPGRSV